MKFTGEKSAGKLAAGNRIGLFGGTFNPVHSGHLQAAIIVMARLSLNSVLFIPAAIPPHKSSQCVISAADRLEMLRLAVAGQPGLSVSEVELSRTGPSYTIDTVRFFLSESPADTRYYLIVGMDAFFEIDTWKSYRDLTQLISLVVLERPDFGSGKPNHAGDAVQDYLRTTLSSSYVFSPESQRFECAGRPPVYLIGGGLRALSATFIRERIRAKADIESLVPKEVAAYIRRKGLYR